MAGVITVAVLIAALCRAVLRAGGCGAAAVLFIVPVEKRFEQRSNCRVICPGVKITPELLVEHIVVIVCIKF